MLQPGMRRGVHKSLKDVILCSTQVFKRCYSMQYIIYLLAAHELCNTSVIRSDEEKREEETNRSR